MTQKHTLTPWEARACNVHDDLVEALRAVAKAVTEAPVKEFKQSISDSLELADRALAKACGDV